MVATEEMHMILCSIKQLLRLPVLYRAFLCQEMQRDLALKRIDRIIVLYVEYMFVGVVAT